ncbi:MAG: UDP-2,3-diacylglucosamine diphosphatase [Puniceicoccaceae bacterium]
MKSATLKFKTIILSDIHLGTVDCKIDEVNFFLKHTHSEKLILNGDIIDGWSLSRRGGWTKAHTRCIRLILKKLEKKNTEVIYLRGNHDDFLHKFLPIFFDKLSIVEEHIHESGGRRYLLVHGDGFDSITTNHKWIAMLGDIGYQSLLRLNRLYNRYRSWRGKPYYSISKMIKARVKSAVSFVDKFETKLQELAEKRECEGVICGHIHTAADKEVGGIRYINSGDWVESMTAVVEDFDGNFEVIEYPAFVARLAAKNEARRGEQLVVESEELPPLEEEPGWETVRYTKS